MSQIHEMEQTLRALQREEKQLERALKADRNSDKRLAINANGSGSKWFVIEGETRSYLPKARREEAAALAKTAWRKARLAEIRSEMTACERYINSFRGKKSHMEQLLANREYCALLGFCDLDADAWQHAAYTHNPSHPENLKIPTNNGTLVRSKSEALIAIYLEKYGIPFRYECLLETPAGALFPDFTIMHPKTHRLYLWEHFGLMDNSAYAASAGSKIGTYMQMGYIPGDNLITTYEGGKILLNLKQVESIIQQTFLHD